MFVLLQHSLYVYPVSRFFVGGWGISFNQCKFLHKASLPPKPHKTAKTNNVYYFPTSSVCVRLLRVQIVHLSSEVFLACVACWWFWLALAL